MQCQVLNSQKIYHMASHSLQQKRIQNQNPLFRLSFIVILFKLYHFGVLTYIISKLFNNYHLFQIVFLMKNRKNKQTIQLQSSYSRAIGISSGCCLKVKFDFTRSNLSCFIGQKRQIKKTVPARSQSRKTRKLSQKNKESRITKQQPSKRKDNEKKRSSQSPDIIRQSANSILNEIQNKGIQCQWKQVQPNWPQNCLQEMNNSQSQLWSVFSVNQQIEKSYASTIDYQRPLYYHSFDYKNNNYSMQKQRSLSFENNNFQVRLQEIGYDPRTTIMIRNIPNKYTIQQLSQEIDYCLANTYDFLYLPCDLKNLCNVGYGFINFVHTEHLKNFYLQFHNKKWAKFRSQKICSVTYARLQGLESLIEHFQNSKVLNQKQKKYRPIIKQTSKIKNLIKTQQKYK